MVEIELSKLASYVDEERRKDVIHILLLTDGLKEINEIMPVSDQRWFKINFPIAKVFFGQTKDLLVSYDECKYTLGLKSSKNSSGGKTMHCYVRKHDVVEFYVEVVDRDPNIISSKIEYNFKIESSIEGFKCLVAKIAEIVYT